jgi:hypothetical protein
LAHGNSPLFHGLYFFKPLSIRKNARKLIPVTLALMTAVNLSQDRRRPRRFTIGNLVAHVDCDDGEPIMVCVWDTSPDGACVIAAPDIKIPDRFTLVIGGLLRPVEKVWRRRSLLGVKAADSLPDIRQHQLIQVKADDQTEIESRQMQGDALSNLFTMMERVPALIDGRG